MVINKREVGNAITPATILFLICVLWLNGGIIRFISSFNATVFLLIFAVGLFLAMIEYSEISIRTLVNSGLFYGGVFLCTILPTSLIVYQSIESETVKILYALFLLLIQLYLKRKSRKIHKIFVFALMLDCISINVRTITTLAVSSEIARIYASGSEAVIDAGFDVYLLGGYGYIYSLVFAMLFCFIERDRIRNLTKPESIAVWLFIISSLVVIIEAQYTIAILVLIIGTIFVLITRRGIDIKTIFLSALIGVLFILIGELLLYYLINANIFGPIVTDRLTQLVGLLSGNVSSNGDLALRGELYLKTLKYLPKCFLFGTYESIQQANTVLGWHTEWIDRLARFGIIRYTFYIAFLFKSIKYSLPKSQVRNRYTIFVVCLVFLGAVNPILNNSFYVVMFVIIPFIFPNNSNC